MARFWNGCRRMTEASSNSSVEPLIAGATDDLIQQKVCALLAPYNHKGTPILRQTSIMSDLEVDSVAVFDLIMEVEDAYEITFPMETVSETNTVGDLVDTIRALKKA